MKFNINPGTEAVENPTLENAEAAIDLFIKDLDLDVKLTRNPDGDNVGTGIGGGRFSFVLTLDDRSTTIDMPGCDPEKTAASRPWYSPRLYVDGSSWLWRFAVNQAIEALIYSER